MLSMVFCLVLIFPIITPKDKFSYYLEETNYHIHFCTLENLDASQVYLDERLNHSNEYMSTWLNSVQEAHRRQEIYRDMQTKITQYFLSPMKEEAEILSGHSSVSSAEIDPG